MKEYRKAYEWVKDIIFRRHNSRLEKKDPSRFKGLSSSRPPLKLITLKWPPSTSFSTSEVKSPTSIISQSTITLAPGQLSSPEPGTLKRSQSLDLSSIAGGREYPIPTYYESTLTTEKTLSPASSTHPTLIGQLIDSKRHAREQSHQTPSQRPGPLALPDIDESDAFTIDSFSYYEGSVAPCTSSTLSSRFSSLIFSSSTPSNSTAVAKSLATSTTPPTPPHPPSPRFAFAQHSLPPPPVRKQPRAVGSLSSLLRLSAKEADAVDERGRYSRGDFSFHHSHGDSQQQPAYARSPLQHDIYPRTYPGASTVHTIDLMQDVPEDVGPNSYTRPGALDSLPEREEFTSGGYVPLKRKGTVLDVEEGGVINVVVQRSASIDEGSVV